MRKSVELNKFVENKDGELGLREFMQYIIDTDDALFFGHDDSFIYQVEGKLEELNKEYDLGAVTWECIGCGRMFDNEDELYEQYKEEIELELGKGA